MTLSIFAPDPAQAVPRDLVLDLHCDGGSLLYETVELDASWYPRAASAAVRAGWTLTAERQLGPCCSRKKSDSRTPGERP